MMPYKILQHDVIDSTSEEAKRLALSASSSESCVIAARLQTAGRGRLGRTWASPRGNLYASILLYPECSIAVASQLAFVAALAVGEAARECLPESAVVEYKWPNDILANGKKLAGILVESAAQPESQKPAWLVVGMGVNVVSFPELVNKPVTSLRTEGAEQESVDSILQRVLIHFEKAYAAWQADGFSPIREAWLQHAWKKDQPIQGSGWKGIMRDMTPSGELVLELADGTTKVVVSGEIGG